MNCIVCRSAAAAIRFLLPNQLYPMQINGADRNGTSCTDVPFGDINDVGLTVSELSVLMVIKWP